MGIYLGLNKELNMGLTSDIIPFSESKKFFSRITDEVSTSKDKETIITKNGRAFVVMISPEKLDYYHDLAKNRAFSNLLDETEKGIEDIKQGRTYTLAQFKKKLKKR
jgi:hypothetical protein